MTVREAALLFGRSESTIQRWCSSGRLKALKSWRKVDRQMRDSWGFSDGFHKTAVCKFVIDGRHAKALFRRERAP